MSLQCLPKMKWKAAILVLMAGFIACPGAQAAGNGYNSANQPDASYGTPLPAGKMTLEDVLETHPLPKKPPLQPPTLAAGSFTTAAPPVLSPVAQPSTENDMLMQGMVQQTGNAAPLTPPQLPAAPHSFTPQAPIATYVPAAASPSGIQYQPGQAPKNLATNGSPSYAPPMAVAPAPQLQGQDASVLSSGAAQPVPAASAGNCTFHSEKWTKSCVDAGYPDNFTGQIEGETHTTCPEGTLQDVWMSNSCAPPENATSDGGTAALSAPSSSQAASQAMTSPLASQFNGDGSCGPANGPAVNAKPVNDLCSSGEPTEVMGDGPWTWSCRGTTGGMTVSCAAAVGSSPAAFSSSVSSNGVSPALSSASSVSENHDDGQCGAANGVVVDYVPTADLCTKGTASQVSGDGPWTWACSGSGSGQASACNAPKKTDGVCGSASSTAVDGMPTSDLCTAGYASAVAGSGPWNWTCSGLYGGSPALCSAAPRQDAVCGLATTYSHRESPIENLCSVGQPSGVNGGGPWTWLCNGVNGGAPVSCAAPISVKGVCGTANGAAISSAPTDGLCLHGKSTRVTGNGPWSWTCSGTDGGESQSCAAPVGHAAAGEAETEQASSSATSASSAPSSGVNQSEFVSCGAAADFAAFSAPAKDLCKKGQAGAVSGDGPWSWSCSDASSHKTECSTLSPSGSFSEAEKTTLGSTMPAPMASPSTPVVVAEEKPGCGAAAGQGTATAPSKYLCSGGKASKIRGEGPWGWTCEKATGKNAGKVSCEAPKLADGVCGAANGSLQRATPASELCSTGSATPVQGTGPWMWSCVGVGGGVSASCSVGSQLQTRIDGSCGSAVNASSASAPTANLCDGGMPSAIYGNGPWNWTCSGLNGGMASPCSTQKDASSSAPMLHSGSVAGEGSCGNANGVPVAMKPEAGLCATGVSSIVTGRGPWTWSCSAPNGGGAVACIAPLVGEGSANSQIAPSAEAPAPQSAATSPVTSMVTLSSSEAEGNAPPAVPPSSFPPMPQPSAMPPVLPPEPPVQTPVVTPDLPTGTQVLQPPSMRDTIKPASALIPSAVGAVAKAASGHLVLPDDVSMISFKPGAESLDPGTLPTLDKLALVMEGNGAERIVLTSYAGVGPDTSPRDARRLSLTRALAIRDYLTAKGIASARINVRALGANAPSGDPDRVDIKPE